jgi:hypothetical protein
MSELIVNLRNRVRAERDVPADVESVRQQMEQYGALLAAHEQMRAEALQRVMKRAAKDEMLADLLLALGLV